MVMTYRDLGAPVFFVCWEGQMQWWRQGVENPQYLETVSTSELPRFFQEHRQNLAPHAIYLRGREVASKVHIDSPLLTPD